MNNEIRLLDASLLGDVAKLREIDHWLSVFNWPNGWHYDLDIIWILKNIEDLNLPKGSVIVDAGAGLGMTQFILAARGYNVISLDFTRREIPKFAQGIFEITVVDRDLGEYEHEYMEWMKYGKKENFAITSLHYFNKCVSALRKPHRTIYIISTKLNNIFNVNYRMEKRKNHDGFGTITFLRGTFNNIPLESESADLLISVSAFEHNAYEDMPGSVIEFDRVLKKRAWMLITTSAAEEKDWYFKPCKGWNFSYHTLYQLFNIEPEHPYAYDQILDAIKNNKLLKSRISPFYRFNGENGLPFAKLDEAKFVPVGIKKRKE